MTKNKLLKLYKACLFVLFINDAMHLKDSLKGCFTGEQSKAEPPFELAKVLITAANEGEKDLALTAINHFLEKQQ